MLKGGKKLYPPIAVLLALAALTVLFLKCMAVVKIALIALVIAYLLAPAVSHLERKMHRSVAILIVYASALVLMLGAVVLILFPILSEMTHLPEHAARLSERISGFEKSLTQALNKRGVSGDVFGALKSSLGAGAGNLLSGAVSVLSGAAGFFANALAALALSWFFLIDWEKLSLRLFLCVPSGIRPKVLTALSTVRRDLGQYLKAQTLLILFMLAITVSVLFAVGAPMPVSLGAMYALLNAIPYFGPLIGTIPPVLAALAVSPAKALYTLLALLFIQQVDNYVLSPRIMGAASNSGPATVLIAISAGGALGGVAGMFLALPTLVTAKSVYRVFTAPKA